MSFRPRLEPNEHWENLINIAREVGPEKIVQCYLSANSTIEDSPIIVLTGDKVKDLDQLLDKYNVNRDEWNVDKAKINDWVTHIREGDKIVPKVNYQIKAELSRRVVKLKPIEEILDEYLDKLTTKLPKRTYKKQESNKTPIVVVISDIHLGSFHKNKITEQHSPESIMRKLSEVAEITNSHESPTYVVFLGDLIESFTGKNKEDTWKTTIMHGAELALSAYDLLSNFIHSLNHFEKLYMVSGNHDRITDSKNDDPHGQVLHLIYGMFKRLNPNINVEYDPIILNPSIDGVRYILSHGEHKISKMKPEELVFLYGDSSSFNVIIHAHLHNRAVGNDTYKFRSYVTPSICSGSDYSERNGWYSNSGFLIFKAHGNSVHCFDYNLEP